MKYTFISQVSTAKPDNGKLSYAKYTVSDLIRGELKGLSTSNIRLANFGW